MTLTEKGYKPRLLDQQMRKMLGTFGAISIEGPKWCGKTWTMLNHAMSVSYLMDQSTREKAQIDPTTALEGALPHAIDEWQIVPGIWDAVRFAVDKNLKRGQFLLSGSVTPPRKGRLHSGIGRISTVRMRTLSLYESGDSSGDISLKDLLVGNTVEPKTAPHSVDDLIALACKGGWPINISAAIEDPYALPKDYLWKVITDEYIDDEGNKRKRDQQKFSYFLGSLARNNASLVKNSTIHNEVQNTDGEFASSTLSEYLSYLRKIYLLEELPGWHPQIRSKTRILSAPKRFLTDPSLVVAALGATKETLSNDLQTFGSIFEGMCLRDLLVYTDMIGANVFHYRDNSQLEVDAIIEKADGVWGAFEIKLGGSTGLEAGAKSLLRLKDKMIKAGYEAPACLVILTASQISMPRKDGVMIVPIGTLKD